MRHTTRLAPIPETASLNDVLFNVRQRLSYIEHRFRETRATVERANLYGQQDTLSDILDWLSGILKLELPDEQIRIHLRQLAKFIKARYNQQKDEAARQEDERLNSLEWRQLSNGKLQGYEFGLAFLAGMGIHPLR